MYKRGNGEIPEMLIPLTPINSVSQASTRQSSDFYMSLSRTNLGSRELEKKLSRIWYNLPREIREVTTLTSFKRKLKEYLLVARG